MTLDGKVIFIELWDFPGTCASERTHQLMSTFFQAAIICYSVEDEVNAAAVTDLVGPSEPMPQYLMPLKITN